MMKNNFKIGVCSRSFSLNTTLKNELNSFFSNVKYNENGDKLNGDSLINFLFDCDLAITALEQIDEKVLSNLPNLKLISKYGVGTDMIDFNALNKFGVDFHWEGGVNKRSVAELTITFALLLVRNIPIMQNNLKNEVWQQSKGTLLTNKKFGIIGCGHIGKDLIKLLKPFNCDILVHDILEYTDYYEENNVKKVDLDYLLANSDIISLHIPLNNTTKNLLSMDKLSLLQSHAILINTSRGGIVDELYLKEILMNNKIGGAAFDVFNSEPPNNYELFKLQNFYSTPHIGGSSNEAILAMGRSAIEGLVKYAKI